MKREGKDIVRIFDTTLRDGEQAARINLNVAEKLQIAKQLAVMAVDVIEAGFPAASPGDFACVQEIARVVEGPTIAALARTREEDVRAAAEALGGAAKSRIHVFIATSALHMREKLKMTPGEVLEAIRRSVRFAASLSGEVEFSAEDASRSDPKFLAEAFKTAAGEGASILNIADTVGYAMPSEFADFVANIIDAVGASANMIYSVHCHNDLGLAVANSLAAVGAGARQIEGTINGLGERGGNASLEEAIMAIRTRRDFYGADVGVDTTKLTTISRLVSRLTGVPVPPNKPIVGANAFSHEAGIHQHGVMANRETYEIMRAEEVGAEAAVLVLGKHSGRHAFSDRLAHLGYNLSPEQLDRAFASFKRLCDEKKDVSDGDIEAMVAAEIISVAPERRYALKSYEIECGTNIIGGPTARVVLETSDGQDLCDAAVGNGPIDAAYIAMQRIVKLDLELVNFAIGATSRSSDAVGEAQVTVRYAGVSAPGRGASTDTVEACIKAYVEAVNNLYIVAAAKGIRMNGKG